jgi:A/G-specific adenine glycosylase
MAKFQTSKDKLTRLRAALLSWYERNRRDLPWRRSRDPYAIWVSEVMLQQTRVAAVVEKYQAFMARFPTVFALALAPEQEVLAQWSGLGY